MSFESIISIFSFIFCSGVVYGTLSNRLRHVEKLLHDQKFIAERLARIETQQEFIIEQIKKIIK